MWARTRGEIFYRNGDQVVAATYTPNDQVFSISSRATLFEISGTEPPFDVHPDGDRFVMVRSAEALSGFILVLNWFEELKAKAGN